MSIISVLGTFTVTELDNKIQLMVPREMLTIREALVSKSMKTSVLWTNITVGILVFQTLRETMTTQFFFKKLRCWSLS